MIKSKQKMNRQGKGENEKMEQKFEKWAKKCMPMKIKIVKITVNEKITLEFLLENEEALL